MSAAPVPVEAVRLVDEFENAPFPTGRAGDPIDPAGDARAALLAYIARVVKDCADSDDEAEDWRKAYGKLLDERDRLRAALRDLLDQIDCLNGIEYSKDTEPYKAKSNWNDVYDRACEVISTTEKP